MFERLHRDFISDAASGSDRTWKNHIASEVTSANVELSAILADRKMTIGELQKLTIGETVTFPLSPPPHVDLRAGGVTIGSGRLGRSGEVVAVKLDASVDVGAMSEDAA